MRPENQFDKVLDLEPTEYREASRPEPFFGPAGKPVAILFALSFPITALATVLVTGELPYWLKHLLQ